MEGGLLVKWNRTLITRREFDVGINVELIKGNIGIIECQYISSDFIGPIVTCYYNRD